jgi:hypothetical protein
VPTTLLAQVPSALPPPVAASPGATNPVPPPPAVAVPAAESAVAPAPAPAGGAPASSAAAADASASAADPVAPLREPSEIACLHSGSCRLTDIKTPTAPAFTIIGVTPSEVETPRTPKDVALTLYNALKSGNLPQDLALELAPYWLVSHPMLTFDDYVAAPVPRQIAQNFTLSAATVGVEEPSGTARTNVGIGARTHLFFADDENGGALAKARDALSKHQKAVNAATAMAMFACKGEPVAGEDVKCAELRRQLREAGGGAGGDVDAKLASAAAELQSVLAARSGFSVGAAGALAFQSPQTEFDLSNFTRGAVWLTLAYRNADFDVSGVLRHISIDTDSERQLRFLDAGARLGGRWPTYGIYLEGMYRTVSGDAEGLKSSGRLAGTFEYTLSESVNVSATFGKDLDDEAGKGGLISLLGLSFQVSKERSVEVPKGL